MHYLHDFKTHSKSNTFYNYFHKYHFFYWIYIHSIAIHFETFFLVHWHKQIFMYSKTKKNNQDKSYQYTNSNIQMLLLFFSEKRKELQGTCLTVILLLHSSADQCPALYKVLIFMPSILLYP